MPVSTFLIFPGTAPTTTQTGYYGLDYRPVAPTPLRAVSATPATLAAQVAGALPGDRIELATGSYGEWDIEATAPLQGTLANPIIITPAAGATVTFTEIDIREDCSHVWFGQFQGEAQHTNFIIDRGGVGGACLRVGWDQLRSGSHVQNTVDNLKFCGIHFTDVGYNHIVIKGGATDIDVINNRFTLAGQLFADLGENIYIGQSSTSNPSPNERILVQGNIFEGATADVVDVKMSNVQGIDILDNYFDTAVFGDASDDHFTNGAVGITEIQTQQVRDPQIRVLRNVFHDLSHVGTVSRSRAITTSAPGEYAYNIVFRTGRESMRVNHVGTPPGWWTTALKYDFHHNTCFDHSSIAGGSGECIFFSGMDAAAAARLRYVSNVVDGAVTEPAGIAESSDNHSAVLADFVGPTAGSANAGTHVGSGYQLALSSTIPATAGALGKSGSGFGGGSVSVIASGELAYNSGVSFTVPTVQDGDVLLTGVSAAGSGDPGAASGSIPAGALTSIYSDKPDAGNFRPRQTLLGRVLTSGDSGDTCTINPGTLADSTGWVVLRGLAGLPGSKQQNSGDLNDGIVFPSIAASVGEVLILHGSAQSSTPVAGDASSLAIGVTEILTQLNNNRGQWLAIHEVTSAGTIDPGTLLDTGSNLFDNWVATITKATPA